MSNRQYPVEPTDPFPRPPRSFIDEQERSIELHTVEDQIDPLVKMYQDYEPENRSQGVPPANKDDIPGWVESLYESGVDVLAWHKGDVIGHATLVPYDESHELSIFVLQSYHNAGIGTQLTETLLGQGQTEGIERVWLTTEQRNDPAISVFQKVGFEYCRETESEVEMFLRLS